MFWKSKKNELEIESLKTETAALRDHVNKLYKELKDNSHKTYALASELNEMKKKGNTEEVLKSFILLLSEKITKVE